MLEKYSRVFLVTPLSILRTFKLLYEIRFHLELLFQKLLSFWYFRLSLLSMTVAAVEVWFLLEQTTQSVCRYIRTILRTPHFCVNVWVEGMWTQLLNDTLKISTAKSSENLNDQFVLIYVTLKSLSPRDPINRQLYIAKQCFRFHPKQHPLLIWHGLWRIVPNPARREIVL